MVFACSCGTFSLSKHCPKDLGEVVEFGEVVEVDVREHKGNVKDALSGLSTAAIKSMKALFGCGIYNTANAS